jgi:hypothetical protein
LALLARTRRRLRQQGRIAITAHFGNDVGRQLIDITTAP